MNTMSDYTFLPFDFIASEFQIFPVKQRYDVRILNHFLTIII